MTKQKQKDFMMILEVNDLLNETMANNFIDLIELNDEEVSSGKELLKVLNDLLDELIKDFYYLVSDNYDLEFDDFLNGKIYDKRSKGDK